MQAISSIYRRLFLADLSFSSAAGRGCPSGAADLIVGPGPCPYGESTVPRAASVRDRRRLGTAGRSPARTLRYSRTAVLAWRQLSPVATRVYLGRKNATHALP